VDAADARVTRAIELMDTHRTAPLSVAELAHEVNLSPSYLRRLFLAHTGRTPARYDKDCRLDRAHELITSTFLTVKEVMAAVGWNDPSHFGREFKRRFGVAPRGLRARIPR
jgi:transcriptional regulator GlxA family with amidase domain